jgi:hypothetical protein
LAKAQVQIENPEKSLTATMDAHFADGEQRFHAMVSRYFARS